MLHCMILIITLWLWKRMVQLCTKGWTVWALCLNWLPTGSEIYVLECVGTRAYVRTCVRVLRETHMVGKMPIIDESGYTVLCTLFLQLFSRFLFISTKSYQDSCYGGRLPSPQKLWSFQWLTVEATDPLTPLDLTVPTLPPLPGDRLPHWYCGPVVTGPFHLGIHFSAAISSLTWRIQRV